MVAALVGAIVGALVASLVAGLILAADGDDSASATRTPATASAGSGTGGRADIKALLLAAEPSVVSIQSDGGTGSGFVLTEDGLIVTNDHVISGATSLQVTFLDGSTADAELVGSFPDQDVAMIRVPRDDLVPARLGSSARLQVGDEVVAIGNAYGLGVQPSVTTGIVSAKERAIRTDDGLLEHLLQTDAAINPGNSGGPLIDAKGEVVGINTANIPGAQAIGFAISIDAVKDLIEELKAGRGEINPDNAFLGVSTLAVDDASVTQDQLDEYGVTTGSGALVLEVTPGSAAERAGLEEGDVVKSVDGTEVRSSDDLGSIMRRHVVGDRVDVVIERRGQTITETVVLGRRGG